MDYNESDHNPTADWKRMTLRVISPELMWVLCYVKVGLIFQLHIIGILNSLIYIYYHHLNPTIGEYFIKRFDGSWTMINKAINSNLYSFTLLVIFTWKHGFYETHK